MMKSVNCTLRSVRALLGDEANFSGDEPAIDALGQPCRPNDPSATRFSVFGAIVRASDGERGLTERTCSELSRVARRAVTRMDSAYGHASVLIVIDRAIKQSNFFLVG